LILRYVVEGGFVDDFSIRSGNHPGGFFGRILRSSRVNVGIIVICVM